MGGLGWGAEALRDGVSARVRRVAVALAGPDLIFLRARLAERCGDVAPAATLVTECLKELPGFQGYLDFAVDVGAARPSRARQIRAARAAGEALIAKAHRDGQVS